MKSSAIFFGLLVVVIGLFGLYRSVESPDVTTQPNATSTSTGSTTTYSLRVPEMATSTYVTFTDWPPRLYVLTDTYHCTTAGTPEQRAGQTTEQVIGGATFCVTDEAEGAAGSVYHQYAYVTVAPTGELLSYTFTVREVQCLNYDEPEASTCASEQAAFDPNKIAAALLRNTTAH